MEKGTKCRRTWLKFTIGDVCAVVGRAPQTVRADARNGLVDRRDLASVVRYVAGKPTDLTEARRLALALAVALDVDKAPAWKPGDNWQAFGGKIPKAKGIP